MDGENNGSKPLWTNGWFGGKFKHTPYFRKATVIRWQFFSLLNLEVWFATMASRKTHPFGTRWLEAPGIFCVNIYIYMVIFSPAGEWGKNFLGNRGHKMTKEFIFGWNMFEAFLSEATWYQNIRWNLESFKGNSQILFFCTFCPVRSPLKPIFGRSNWWVCLKNREDHANSYSTYRWIIIVSEWWTPAFCSGAMILWRQQARDQLDKTTCGEKPHQWGTSICLRRWAYTNTLLQFGSRKPMGAMARFENTKLGNHPFFELPS